MVFSILPPPPSRQNIVTGMQKAASFELSCAFFFFPSLHAQRKQTQLHVIKAEISCALAKAAYIFFALFVAVRRAAFDLVAEGESMWNLLMYYP